MFASVPAAKPATAKKTAPPKSAFKTLIFELLENKGDFSKLSQSIRKSSLKCQVNQAFPKFLVSDGTYFLSAYFTKDCIRKCHAEKDRKVNITDLQGGLISINKWEVELIGVNSAEEFISYQNVEMRLVVHEFKALYGEQLKLRKFPANLFRDDEVKALIQHFIQEERSAHLKGLKRDFDASKPLLTLREANTVSLLDPSKGSKQSADEEIFSAFTHLLPKNKQVETVNLQEIYVAEKGPDALRQFNINFHFAQKKEVPCLEKKARNLKHGRRASHDDSRKQPAVVEKVKKSLKIGGKDVKDIKVTTTIVKKSAHSKVIIKKRPVAKKAPKKAPVIVKRVVKKANGKVAVAPKAKLTVGMMAKLAEQKEAAKGRPTRPSAAASPLKKKK
ncbi:hypothetical protein FGO68_gene15921 [Halteria grandinella]|uniref:Uncharacterized protein n=1 Tax=Halteria grandinella TaxID=5974 RepID=A0A8J8T0Q1_HALGN|nr:hypothetical protein FGO68_gene15921 [Halteria grandinella]